MEVRGGFSDEYGDGIFKLFPLLLQQDGLSPRRIQERFLFRNVESRGHAAFVTRIHELQAFLQILHSTIQNSQLRIKLP